MNNIKTYLNNLTKADIENATKEELALIIDYMEQMKGDLDFSALIKDKVEQFKQFATEANNKIILEAALQEQQEKQELLRERVRFMRNLDYIEKTVQVQNTREEDSSRIQRNIERQQQQNIQAQQIALLTSMFKQSLAIFDEITNSKEYKLGVKRLEEYLENNPDKKAFVSAINLPPNKDIFNNEIYRLEQAVKNGTISKQESLEAQNAAANLMKESAKNACISPPEKAIEKQQETMLDYTITYLGFNKEVRKVSGGLAKEYMKALASYYGISLDELTQKHAEDFKKGLENGSIPKNALEKHSVYAYAFNDSDSLKEIQSKRRELQERYYREDSNEVKNALIVEMYKEINLKVTQDNLKKSKDDENLKDYGIQIVSSSGQIGYLAIKAKDGGSAIHEFSTVVLQTGMKDIRDNHQGDIRAMEAFLSNFVGDTKFILENKEEGSTALFNSVNQDFSKLRALELYREEIKGSPLEAVLKNHIKTMETKLIQSAMKDFGISRDQAEDLVSKLTIEDFEKYSSYGAFNAYKENKLHKQVAEKVIEDAVSIANVALKAIPTNQNKSETEQEMLDRLVKEGMSLGEIKEKYPQLDKLVAKEHEAVAFNQENANEQTKEAITEHKMNQSGFDSI